MPNSEPSVFSIEHSESSDISWRRVDSFPGNHSSPATTELRPCPICGSNRSRSILQFDQFQFFSDSKDVPKRVDIRHAQCLDCFALYLNPCYTSYGFEVFLAEAGASYGSTLGRPKEEIDWLASRGLLKSGSRFLDAGCYDGGFLAHLPENVERIGVDIDEPAIARGRKAFGPKGIQLILGDLENFSCHQPPDVITMFQVLEHLPRPVAVLQHLRSMAHSGTRLVVDVPVLEHGKTNDINGFLSAFHTTHFSRLSLENCLQRSGWKTQESQQQPDYNGFRVVATPASPSNAQGKDYGMTSLLRDYLADWNLSVKAVEDRLARLPQADKCIIWGAGAHTEFLYHVTSFFLSKPERQYAIVDSDPLKHGKSWRGLMIYPPHILKNAGWDLAYVVVSSYGGTFSIVKAASELGVPANRVIALYDKTRLH